MNKILCRCCSKQVKNARKMDQHCNGATHKKHLESWKKRDEKKAVTLSQLVQHNRATGYTPSDVRIHRVNALKAFAQANVSVGGMDVLGK